MATTAATSSCARWSWSLVDAIIAEQAGPEAAAHLHAWRDHPAFEIFSRPETEYSAFAVQEGLDWIHSGAARTSPKPVPECSFQLGQARYGILCKAHIEPPLEWLVAMAEE